MRKWAGKWARGSWKPVSGPDQKCVASIKAREERSDPRKNVTLEISAGPAWRKGVPRNEQRGWLSWPDPPALAAGLGPGLSPFLPGEPLGTGALPRAVATGPHTQGETRRKQTGQSTLLTRPRALLAPPDSSNCFPGAGSNPMVRGPAAFPLDRIPSPWRAIAGSLTWLCPLLVAPPSPLPSRRPTQPHPPAFVQSLTFRRPAFPARLAF